MVLTLYPMIVSHERDSAKMAESLSHVNAFLE